MLFAVPFLSFFLFFLSFVLYLLHAIISDHYGLRPSQGFLGTAEKGIYFRGTGEQRLNFEETGKTKTILGNWEHKKTNFRFLGNRGTSQSISGEQGNRYPPWEGLIMTGALCTFPLQDENLLHTGYGYLRFYLGIKNLNPCYLTQAIT